MALDRRAAGDVSRMPPPALTVKDRPSPNQARLVFDKPPSVASPFVIHVQKPLPAQTGRGLCFRMAEKGLQK